MLVLVSISATNLKFQIDYFSLLKLIKSFFISSSFRYNWANKKKMSKLDIIYECCLPERREKKDVSISTKIV